MPESTAKTFSTHTVLSSWTRVLISALKVRGIDTQSLLAQTNLNPTDIAQAGKRLPLSATTQLWTLAAQATNDESLGLWVSKSSTQTTFHALGYAFMASKNLLEAFERIVRFNKMVSDAANTTLALQHNHCDLEWSFSKNEQAPAHEAMEAVISSIIRASRKLTSSCFRPIAVELMRPPPTETQPFLDFFGCQPTFNATSYRLRFNREDLEQTLPEAVDELARSNDLLVEDYLNKLSLSSTHSRLRNIIIKELPNGSLSSESYAKILGLSSRTLHRKLQAEGYSFKQVLNDTRRDLAKNYLQKEQQYSLTEIAFLLGFADSSSFSRAFRRWTGVSPSHYGDNRPTT